MRLKHQKILILLLVLVSIVLIYKSSSFTSSTFSTHVELLRNKNFKLDIDKNVLVFVHVQKTGGSDFDRNIVKHLLIKSDYESGSWKKACHFTLNKTVAENRNVELVGDDGSHKLKKDGKSKKRIKFKKFACERNVLVANQEPNWYSF
jgi:hypothetical protein